MTDTEKQNKIKAQESMLEEIKKHRKPCDENDYNIEVAVLGVDELQQVNPLKATGIEVNFNDLNRENVSIPAADNKEKDRKEDEGKDL